MVLSKTIAMPVKNQELDHRSLDLQISFLESLVAGRCGEQAAHSKSAMSQYCRQCMCHCQLATYRCFCMQVWLQSMAAAFNRHEAAIALALPHMMSAARSRLSSLVRKFAAGCEPGIHTSEAGDLLRGNAHHSFAFSFLTDKCDTEPPSRLLLRSL